MTQKEENVDSTENTSQLFHLMVPKKKKTKKQQPETSKGFKVGAFSRSPHWFFGGNCLSWF